jgi:hypothetical protein
VKLLIVNTYSGFRDFWKLAETSSPKERLRLYHEMYVAKHREFFDVYFWRFGSKKRLLEALKKYEEIGVELEEAGSRVEGAIERTLSKASKAFEVYNVDLDFVLLLGTFSTDGFTVPFKQSQTIFFALEVVSQYPESLLAALVAHEISHGFHATILSRTFSKYDFKKLPPLPNLIRLGRRRPQGFIEVFRPRFWRAIPVIRTMMKDTNWIANAIVTEGIATCASKKIVEHAQEFEYLLYRNAEPFKWCQNNEKLLFERLLQKLECRDDETYRRYFGGKHDGDIPFIRTGYYVSHKVVDKLLESRTLNNLCKIEPTKYPSFIKECISSLQK